MLSCIGIGWRRAIWKKKPVSTCILMVCGFYFDSATLSPDLIFIVSPFKTAWLFIWTNPKLNCLQKYFKPKVQIGPVLHEKKSKYRYMKNCNTRCTKLSQKRLLYVKTFFFSPKNYITHVLEKQRHINCFNEFYIQKLAVSKLISHTPIYELKQVRQQ